MYTEKKNDDDEMYTSPHIFEPNNSGVYLMRLKNEKNIIFRT